MAIDGFFIKNLITEVSNEILNNRLEQIHLVTNDIFSFTFYYQKKRKKLNIKLNSPYASLYLFDSIINKDLTSNFLSTLKKQLEGSILKSIEQHSMDRVIILTFEKNDFLEGKINFLLIIELMGRYNNLILVKDNVVIDAYFKNVSQTSRSIVPNITFSFFPTNKSVFNINDYHLVDNESYLTKNYIGVSPLLSKYLFNNKIDVNDIKLKPTYNKNNNQFYWFDLFDNKDDLIYFDSLSELLINLINSNINVNDRYFDFVSKRIIRYEKRLFNLNKQLNDNKLKLNFVDIGNLIYSCNYPMNSYHSEIIVSEQVIKLDSNLTLNANAQNYFNIYKKSKRSIEHLNRQIEENTYSLEILKQIEHDLNSTLINHLEIIETLKPFGFKTKKNKTKTVKKITTLKYIYNDNIYYVGLNNYQNEYLTNTLSNKNDYWFHVENYPGSHVILKGILNEESLQIASMLALKYSKIESSVGLVNYTQVKNLRKINGLPGYHVILKSYKTIKIELDNHLLGKVEIANTLKKL